MNSHAPRMFLLRPLFWLAALFAVGCLSATTLSQTGVIHNGSARTIQVIFQWRYYDFTEPAGYYDAPGQHIIACKPGDTNVAETFNATELQASGHTYFRWELQIQTQGDGATSLGNSKIVVGDGSEYHLGSLVGDFPGAPFSYDITPYSQPTPTPDVSKTLWVQTDSTLNGNLFREGIDKVVYASELNAAKASSGGGGGMSLEEFKTSDTDQFAKAQFQIKSDTEAYQTAHDPELDAAVSQFNALMPHGPTTLPYEVPTDGDGDWMKITMPERFGGQVVDFNPFRSDRMGPLASWIRQATTWFVLMLLAYFIFEQTKQFFIAAAVTRQAQGNPVAGGTGAQATALIAAGIITALFVVLVTGFMAWSFGDITIPTLVTNMSTNPLAGAPAHILWFLNVFLPLGTILSAFTARIAFPLYGQTLYGGFLVAVRWVVP